MNARRRFALVLACSLVFAAVVPAAAKSEKKKPAKIQNVVIVMMENRSFDHLLGWHPTANAMQSELSYADDAGVVHPTIDFAPDYQACGFADPDHTWEGGRIDYNGGLMDGFLKNENCDPAYCPRPNANDEYAISYYGQEVRPFFNQLALEYTTFDNFFSSILSSTYPNRIFAFAAQTDRLENSLAPVTLPTIWDRLIEKGVSARYYHSDASFLWLWGLKYLPISRTYDEFLEDAANGTLPAVSWIEPRFLGAGEGVSGDDHPFADLRTGDAFLADTFHAVANGPQWGNTVFIVTYDEWGGFFDHVPPPRAVAPNAIDPDLVDGKALLGMRIPVVVASPFTRGDPANPRVVSTVFDNTSILKLIESRWDLAPLTARDASSDIGDLTTALDLLNPKREVPSLPQPAPPPINFCELPFPTPEEGEVELEDLIDLAPIP